jgi:iron complex transport system permease protein
MGLPGFVSDASVGIATPRDEQLIPAHDVLVDDYRRRTRRIGGRTALISVPLLALGVFGLLVGASSYGIAESWGGLWAAVAGQGDSTLIQRVVWELRVPRVLTAIVSGIALAVAGLVMQTILRNPLASPYTLGVSSAASFGAALAIVFRTGVLATGFALPYEWIIVTNAFVFAMASTAVVYLLTRVQRVTPETIVLLGVAMMFLFSALTSLVQYLGDPDQMAELTYWMFGSLNRATWSTLATLTVVTVAGVVVSYRWVWDLNALTSDDETASSSGVDVSRVRLKGLALASMLTAAVVAFLGPIGFIGLVAPHLARMLVGGDHRFLFPASALLGSVLLLLADIVARTVVAPVVIPVGIITAFVGVPMLVFLMLRRKAEHW